MDAGEKTIYGIYFDGRKDKTITQVKEGNTLKRKSVTEEHMDNVY